MIIPKSRRTYDPEYKKAKNDLKHYMFDTKKLISRIHQLGHRAKDISKCYSKFCSTVTEWYPNTTPAVRQSLQSIENSAVALCKITDDGFISTVVPNFEKAMKTYRKQTNELLKLEKNRKKAVRSLDTNKEKLRKAQCAREPDETKVDQLQRKVDACETTYTTINNEFISAVNEFSETRKDDLLHAFQRCIFGLIEYINNATQISFIKFPDDPNAPLIVDAKTVVNHDDIAQHINQSQPILPPSASNVNGQQMPTYVQNVYGQNLTNSQSSPSTIGYGKYQNQGQMNGQGQYLLPPSAGYRYDPNAQLNMQQAASSAYSSYEVQPNVVEKSVHSSNLISFSSETYSTSSSDDDNDDDDINEDANDEQKN